MPVSLSAVRKIHFSRLDENDHTYLDYTGSALYPSSLIDFHHEQLKTSVIGNPRSSSPASRLSNDRVELTRLKILKFFNADPSKYEVIFTSNATAATKLVAESFPFTRSSTLLLLSDNHNSVNGIREYASLANSSVRYVPLTLDMRSEDPSKFFSDVRNRPNNRNLFAYPAQSNFSGVRHPLEWVNIARGNGWFVLLDAAAYVASSPLDLTEINPHFVTISFYKMFGFPTGIGALIARKSGLSILQRPWFSGGTVKFSSVQNNNVLMAQDASAFEDGSIDFANIPAVLYGLEFLSAISMTLIRNHIASLSRQLLACLVSLRWRNGERAVRIYGPDHLGMRGGTVAFDIIYLDGRRIDARRIQNAACDERISLRVGNFCNPGALEHALNLDAKLVSACVNKIRYEGFSTPRLSRCMGKGYVGCVRVSVGLANNENDVRKFVLFLSQFCKRMEKEWGTRSGFSVDSDGVGQSADERSWRELWGSSRLKFQKLRWMSGSRNRSSYEKSYL